MLGVVEKFKEIGHVFIVTKYMKGGDLTQFFEDMKVSHLTEEQAKFVFKQLAQALHVVHEQGIVHRDIKLLNVFVNKKKNMPLIKLADFGLAMKIDDRREVLPQAGTYCFMSPEVILD